MTALAREAGADKPPRLTCKLVALTCAEYFDVPLAELQGMSRRQPVVRARQVAHWLARNMTGQTLVAIGRMIGGRDHTVVHHSIRAIDAAIEAEPGVAEDIRALIGIIRGVALAEAPLQFTAIADIDAPTVARLALEAPLSRLRLSAEELRAVLLWCAANRPTPPPPTSTEAIVQAAADALRAWTRTRIAAESPAIFKARETVFRDAMKTLALALASATETPTEGVNT